MKRGDGASVSAAAATGARKTLVRRRITNTVRVLGDMHGTSGDAAAKRREVKDGDKGEESTNDGR